MPLLVRLLERGLQEQWRGFELTQRRPVPVLTSGPVRRALFVVGGLTRTELACLRTLEPAFDAVFTTHIIHSASLMDACKATD